MATGTDISAPQQDNEAEVLAQQSIEGSEVSTLSDADADVLSEAPVAAQSSEDVGESTSAGGELTPSVTATTSPSSQSISDDSAEDQPSPVATPAADNQNGITDTGRAVNDPRVSARPVATVAVHTAHLTLFPEHAAPPVSVISRDIARQQRPTGATRKLRLLESRRSR